MHLNKSMMRTENSLTKLLFSLVAISIVMLLGLELFNRYDRAQLAENTAHQLSMQISLAREEAILHKQTLALFLQNHTYQFYIKKPTKNAMWMPLQSDQFLNHNSLPRGIFVQTHGVGLPMTTISNQTTPIAKQLSSTPSSTSATTTSTTTPIQTSSLYVNASSSMQPAIIFYPKGNITAFTIDVGMKNLTPNYQIIGTPTGEIDLKVYSDNFMGLPMK